MLTDLFNRLHDYLRVSLTDRCNLRCVYCMPADGLQCMEHNEVLRNEEFVRLIRLFVLLGVRKVRFTGGEPLVRKGAIDIIRQTRALSDCLELAVTTNGLLLGDYLSELAEAGVSKINISLDSLNSRRFAELTRRDVLPQVLANIDKTIETGKFIVKLNAVLFPETLLELDDFIAYCGSRDIELRFIEHMPFSEEERAMGFTSGDELLAALSQRGELAAAPAADTSVARGYCLNRGGRRVRLGIIPPMSHKFCGACNRIRLTADGQVKACLLSSEERSLKDSMRAGASDEELKEIILGALALKGREHHISDETIDMRRTMSKIGG